MKKFAWLVVLLSAAPLAAGTVESTISRKLEGMADALVRGYSAGKAEYAKESLAVLSFSSSEKLAKTKAGFAVSELLTHFLVQKGEFTVVERNLVNKLEEEQKFQAMTGDTDTAVKIGKLIGAKLLVLGSVEKVGGAYQTNARLVRTETGEILATSFEELPAKAFEEEAKPYLNLVPERQAIGLTLDYQYGPWAKAGGESIRNTSGTPMVFDPKNFTTTFVGGGLRYFPTNHLFIDGSYLVPASQPVMFTMSWGVWNRNSPISLRKGYLARLLGGWASSGQWVRWEGAAGAAIYKIVDDKFRDMSATRPCVQLGVKYYPQQRLALGLSLNQEFGSYEVGFAGATTAFRLQGFSIEPSLTLFF
jgi:TolB-like protein